MTTKSEEMIAEGMAAIREAVAKADSHDELFAAFEAHLRHAHAPDDTEDKPSRKYEIEAARKSRADEMKKSAA